MAGTATEKQIQVALKRYSDRAIYVQKCLYYLFRMTPYFKDARPDIIDLVLPGKYRIKTVCLVVYECMMYLLSSRYAIASQSVWCTNGGYRLPVQPDER